MGFADITREAVERALDEALRLGPDEFVLRYGFGPAREYFIPYRGKEFASKAVVGAAHQYVDPDRRALGPGDFNGGHATVEPLLQRLGFDVIRRPKRVKWPERGGATDPGWNIEPGDEVRRIELHDRFGGSRQGGIAPCNRSPNVLVFTSADSGHQHGYFDRWEGETLLYCGEGQTGDQEMTHGNRTILTHREDGRALRLFEGARGIVRYLGEYEVDADEPWSWGAAPASGGGPQRRVIMFRLNPVGPHVGGSGGAPAPDFSTPYEDADEEVSTAPRDEVRVDPDAVDRGLRAHRQLQNELGAWAREHGFEPVRPGPGEPAFDVGWWDGDTLVVVEVKSLRAGLPSKSQLRLGLGQVLDYAQEIRALGRTVRPVLAVESPPPPRWTDVCGSVGVTLVWPAVFERLAFDRSRG